MEKNKPRFPPSLNAVKSEYKIFCDWHGGPITCDGSFAGINIVVENFLVECLNRQLVAG
jgi:hypothetical protein